MKKLTIILTVVYLTLTVTSCINEDSGKVINKEKFSELLTDIHISDALFSEKGLYDRKLNDSSKSYYNYIFIKHNVSRSDFEKSLEYYNKDIEEFVKIYEKIVLSINNKAPQSLHKNSIYNLVDIALENAEALSDLKKYYTRGGKELWVKNKSLNFPEEPASTRARLKQEIKYPCLAVFTSDIALFQDDMSMGLRVEFEVIYRDESKTRIKREIIDNDGEWRTYSMILRTNPEKKPKSIRGAVIKKYNTADTLHIKIKNLSLKLYEPKMDTTLLPLSGTDAIIISSNDSTYETKRKLPFKRKPSAETSLENLNDLDLGDFDDEDFNFDAM